MLSEVKSPLFVLLPPLVILELPDCILLTEDDDDILEEDEKDSVSVNFGDLEIRNVYVLIGDKLIVDFIVFVLVFVIKGDFVDDKLIVWEDVPDEDLECILLVFVGDFIDDTEVRIDLVIDTDPLDVFDVLLDLVFVPDEDDEAVAEDDIE